jgi:hypothetical protein
MEVKGPRLDARAGPSGSGVTIVALARPEPTQNFTFNPLGRDSVPVYDSSHDNKNNAVRNSLADAFRKSVPGAI